MSVIEKFELVEVCHSCIWFRGLERFPSLERGPIRNGNTLDGTETAQNSGQSKAEVCHFKQRIITVADKLAVKLHDRTAPEIMDAILVLEGADRLHDIPEEFTQVLRRLANFGGVLR